MTDKHSHIPGNLLSKVKSWSGKLSHVTSKDECRPHVPKSDPVGDEHFDMDHTLWLGDKTFWSGSHRFWVVINFSHTGYIGSPVFRSKVIKECHIVELKTELRQKNSYFWYLFISYLFLVNTKAYF